MMRDMILIYSGLVTYCLKFSTIISIVLMGVLNSCEIMAV